MDKWFLNKTIQSPDAGEPIQATGGTTGSGNRCTFVYNEAGALTTPSTARYFRLYERGKKKKKRRKYHAKWHEKEKKRKKEDTIRYDERPP